MDNVPNHYKKNKPPKVYMIIITLLAFIPVWAGINFFFGYNSFMGPGVFEGKELIYWQNQILNTSLIIMLMMFIAMLLFNEKKIKIITVLMIMVIPLVSYESFYKIKQYYSIFTAEKWENHKESRHLMFDDMLKKSNLKGKKSKEIEDLLGKPETEYEDIGNKKYKSRSHYLIHVLPGWFLLVNNI